MEVIAKEQPASQPTVVAEGQPEAEKTPVFTDSHWMQILRFFDINEPVGTKTQEQLKTIDAYLKENSKTDSEYLHQLHQLKMKLGTHTLGQTPWGKMFSYIRLLGQQKEIERAIADATGSSL